MEEVSKLKARLETLESAHRRTRRLTSVLILCILGGFLMGGKSVKMLGDNIQLKGPNGKTRIKIGSWSNGFSGLSMYDQAGKPRVNLGVHANGRVRLTLTSPDNQAVSTLQVEPGGDAKLKMGRRNGPHETTLHASKDGAASLKLGRSKSTGVTLEGQPKGGSGLKLGDTVITSAKRSP